jgi:hypothetical protein
MTDLVGVLLTLGAIAAVVALISSPFETLGWWGTWLNPYADEPWPTPHADDARDRPRAYVVYLSGIGSLSGDELLPSEVRFLDALERALPHCRVVRSVFPYSPAGRSLLTGQRVFQWLWRRLERWRRSGRGTAPFLINLRNLFQVLVAADHRYGPVYGFGLAQTVVQHLTRAGYDEGLPVILLGSSGGGQISLAAAPYLAAALDAPIGVVTVGGVMASDRGLDHVVRLTSLAGAKDGIYRLGRRAFPGRWPLMAESKWNRARAEGRLVERVIGPMVHAGKGAYFDPDAVTDTGVPFLAITVQAVTEAVSETLLAEDRGAIAARPVMVASTES